MIDDSSRKAHPEGDKGDHSGFIPRAPRYPIVAPVLFKPFGGTGWREGTTVNISRSGLLFYGGPDIALKTPLEMQIEFPAEVTGDSATRLMCWGRVVRKIGPSSLDPLPALAASISRYRFLHD